ncbi:LPS export ABC transporter periplasmic protein LptC [Hymenobacter sp. 15J16-1T3B]|uniref:LPS export ABC transporter periplasmic protein LptC n=1 Tax=Hymenobacter sp. 15J16-1T3B TaxID=2886941 RepID=UPI001D0F8617|nr:LPS export ABC transporter periplasmic protein LptC [Hymenobacter sp. 15J16-1T3B]MCC3156076.1 LPS export ABC transporter periplasmic protein LptC [Hymenobacter sp. 15J16-1T3B]
MAAGALLVAAALLGGCQDKSTAPKKKVQYTGPTLETTNVLTLFSDSARLQVRLTAKLEQLFENGDQVYPKGMNMNFYAKDGTLVNTLRGDYGKYVRAENRYTVRGHVRVNNKEKQQSLETEELFYDQPRQRIYNDTTTAVRIETPTEVLTGFGMEANEDFSRYKIRKPTGVFSVNAAPTN